MNKSTAWSIQLDATEPFKNGLKVSTEEYAEGWERMPPDLSFLSQEFTESHLPLDQLSALFEQEFEEAMSNSEISMTPMFELPEKISRHDITGEFLVIDVGGSTIRVALVDLSSSTQQVKMQKHWVLQENEKVISSKFFESIAEIIYNEFADANIVDIKNVDIGITWSFPLTNDNHIIAMGKGFQVDPEIQKQDICHLLEGTLRQRGMSGKVIAIINDSIAVSLAGMFVQDHRSNISLILGTGINSSILIGRQLINTELGFFGKLHNPTKYDYLIDERWMKQVKPYIYNDPNDIFQPFEFITSSRFICELLRLIIIDFESQGYFDFTTEFCSEEHSLHGQFICILDNTHSQDEIKSSLWKHFDLRMTSSDIQIVQRIVQVVLARSAEFLASALLGLEKLIPGCTSLHVNYVGSFLQHCGQYRREVAEQSSGRIVFHHLADSSVVGAAVAACINKQTSSRELG